MMTQSLIRLCGVTTIGSRIYDKPAKLQCIWSNECLWHRDQLKIMGRDFSFVSASFINDLVSRCIMFKMIRLISCKSCFVHTVMVLGQNL